MCLCVLWGGGGADTETSIAFLLPVEPDLRCQPQTGPILRAIRGALQNRWHNQQTQNPTAAEGVKRLHDIAIVRSTLKSLEKALIQKGVR
jgi:hypothetical protein